MHRSGLSQADDRMATGWRAVLLAALLALAACLSFIVVEAGRTETDGHEVRSRNGTRVRMGLRDSSEEQRKRE